MSEFIPTEKGVPIRQPSTANLMVDSQNRATIDLSGNVEYGTPANFFINKRQSILNGYFTRIGVTEVVLEWFQPNINDSGNAGFEGNVFAITDASGTHAITIPVGFYNVYTLLQAMAFEMSAESGKVYIASGGNGQARIDLSGGTYEFLNSGTPSSIPERLGFNTDVQAASHEVGENPFNLDGVGYTPDLRIYRYIDFVSNSLTYNQELKDATTADSIDNILCRWYFAEDNQSYTDQYGFPILQGYEAFVRRRLFSPPKQIKWSPQQPIGQIQFQVQYQPPVTERSSALIIPVETQFDFLMTLQVSEV
jgi:hypothetical protein